VVEVPHGKIICPNACEALFLSACIFYLIDLVYRGHSIEWCSDLFSTQRQSMLAYCVRIYFLWLAGFIHTASTMLIWPLDPARLRPAYWHAFLFGVPLVHFIVFIVPSIIFNEKGNKVNEGIVDLLRQLAALPSQEPVSESAELHPALLRQQLSHAWRWATVMAAVLFSFLLLITVPAICSGYTIISRTAKRYEQLKNQAQQAVVQRMSGVSASESNTSSLSRASTVTAGELTESHYYDSSANDIDWRDVGLGRLLLYVAGAKPLRQIGRSGSLSRSSTHKTFTSSGTPSRSAVLAVLKDFLIFSLIHHGAIAGIMLTMSACVLIFLCNAQKDIFSTVHDATFVSAFGRTTYVFLILEVYAIIALGSPLIICVLWRQIYPICVDMDNDVYTRKQPRAFVRSDGSPRKSDVDLSPCDSGLPARWLPSTRLTLVARQHAETYAYPGAIIVKASNQLQSAEQQPCIVEASNEEISIAMDKFVNANVEQVAKANKLQEAFVQRATSAPTMVVAGPENGSSPSSFSASTWESAHHFRINRDFCGVTGVHPGVRQIVLDAIEAGASNKPSALPSSPPRSTLLERRTMAQHRQREHQRSIDIHRMMSVEHHA
jgi:DNA-binding phage protein